MTPPTPYLAAAETLVVLRADLAAVPELVRLGHLASALSILSEARAQLAELCDLITPGPAIDRPVDWVRLQPPLTRPGGRPGEPQIDPAAQPLW